LSEVAFAIAVVGALVAADARTPSPSPQTASLERRGQAGAESVEVLRWDRDGLEIRLSGTEGDAAIVRWDEVRAIDGISTQAEAPRRFGERLWRACARLERGDHALAAPLFEELAEAFREEGSIRERIAIEGVLRTRIRSGDSAASILAALRAMELDRAGVPLPRGSIAPADRIASLDWPDGVPVLPLERLLAEDEADALLESLRGFATPGRAAAPEAVVLAHATLGRRLEPVDSDSTDRSTLTALLERLVDLRARSTMSLLDDRERLLAEASPSAVECWWQAHLGERLLADRDPSIQRRGLLEWLAVAAARPDAPAGRIALRRAVLAADTLGEDDLADRLATLASESNATALVPPEPRESGIRP
jgi:hypothetical protein